MQIATIKLDTSRIISEISPLLFGGFAEHLGRCVYQGIYDPTSNLSDARGFRLDVLAALKEINYTTIRYPGGNFVSGYNWLDGVGDKQLRPKKRELAWQSIESNQFGTNEFIEYCRELNTEPMLAVNLGTGSIQEAANLVEYCNAPTGTYWSDLRASHGYKEPHGVSYWCLGNEMDGFWQIGQLSAAAYADKALQAAKMMHWQDPKKLKLIACGSSGTGMPNYPEWDRTVLETCWDQIEYLSMHHYASNEYQDSRSYLASSVAFEDHVDSLAAAIAYVKAQKRSKHNVYLSWDEWNVWYRAREGQGYWQEAPYLLEETYNLEDALVVAQWLSVFLRRANVLKIACIAQIVNVIAPLMTSPTGILKQSIFYPLQLFSSLARGVSLDALVSAPLEQTALYGDVCVLDVSASFDQVNGKGVVFIVNRSQTQGLHTKIIWQDQQPIRCTRGWQLGGTDLTAVNTFENPKVVVSHALQNASAEQVLPPLSMTVLEFEFMV